MRFKEELKKIPYGYKVYTGRVLSDSQVDAYNMQTEKCNIFIRAGMDVPEELLNGKHHLLRCLAEA